MDIDLNRSKLENLPDVLLIKTKRNKKSGVWMAELINYDVFTEADTFIELVESINDLVCTLFDIPKNLRSKFFYRPMESIKPKDEENADVHKEMTFNILLSPEFRHSLHV